MLAYDVPCSALFFIISGGAPVQEYVIGPSWEEEMAYLEMIRKIIDNENDGL